MKECVRAFICSILFFIANGVSHVYAGNLFSITGSGTAIQSVPVELCLNGVGKISCQRYSLNTLGASILTTIPNKTYVQAGIRVDDPSYSIASGC